MDGSLNDLLSASAECELEKFLHSPQLLPVHDFRKAQRLWPREPDTLSLFTVTPTAPHTDIEVTRDPLTGAHKGFAEVHINGGNLTAKNSTSMQRAPGPPTQNIKGESTDLPFWPGGLDEPDIVSKVVGNEEDFIDFENDLETVPPGFQHGVEFDKPSKPDSNTMEKTEPKGGGGNKIPTLADLMTADVFELSGWDEEEEEEEDDGDGEKKEVAAAVEDDSALKDLELPEGQYSKIAAEVADNLKEQKKNAKQWAVQVDLNDSSVDEFHNKIPKDKMAHKWNFELDPFQKMAILHLHSHDNVFVAAHTSAGKTVIAEYAVALSRDHMTRAIYTSPIKALSNQKFRDFRLTFGVSNVGLLTGDVQINKEAPFLIMTTEILRSMLYTGSDVIRDVEWVVFDEVHYVNDAERGVVWEEVLIMLPAHIGIILLSATVPNAMEFADWVGRTKKKPVYVISTLKRPVPLQHFLYTGNSKQTSDELFKVVTADNHFVTEGYQAALAAKRGRSKSGGAQGSRAPPQYSNPKQDKNIWLSLVHALNKKDKLPIVAFTFSRKRCDDNADQLNSLDLTTSTEKSEIHVFFQQSIKLLKGTDQQLPQVTWMRELLKKGIAVHHSGILPIIKEVIELLFQRGLVKLLFATETFAMGVNMPARTVVFDSLQKHDGTQMRSLHSAEYIQMAGRAGRRGLDRTGTVIMLCKGNVPEASELHKMILGKATQLQSQFRLTYGMLLNLSRVESLRVEDMMKRSFAELDAARQKPEWETAINDVKQNIDKLESLNCLICITDLDEYYHLCSRLSDLEKSMREMLQSSQEFHRKLTPGRVVLTHTTLFHSALAVVLEHRVAESSPMCTLLLLASIQQSSGVDEKSLVVSQEVVMPYDASRDIYMPKGVCAHVIVKLPIKCVSGITDTVLKIDVKEILADHRRRSTPPYRDDPPNASTSRCTQELLRIVETNLTGVQLLDAEELKMKRVEYLEHSLEKKRLVSLAPNYTCIKCPSFNQHFDFARTKARLNDRQAELKFQLSEESLHLLPEYQQRMKVLKRLGYLKESGVMEMKGRVACEMGNHEVIITELLFEGAFSDLEPPEVAAILSCMVLQQSKCSEPDLTESLKKGKENVLRVAAKIALLEQECGLDTLVEDYQAEFKFGLAEVVYQWALGTEFVDIIQLTDVQEGIIVRTIQRLDEICRDVKSAAKTVGDSNLFVKMDRVSSLIKRDIVFAASLYTK